MPPHLHYVEPYVGGGAVLLARGPGRQPAVAGASQGRLRVGQRPERPAGQLLARAPGRGAFQQFRRAVEAMPFARVEWEAAHAHIYGHDPVADAVAFFVDCRQSLAGRMTGFTGVTRTRTRRGMNGNASEWVGAVDGLAAVLARLRRVIVENLPALDLIRREDGPGTLFYCDPPYLHDTRAATDAYAFEMSEADHRGLLEALRQCRGKVMLSGYPSELYDRTLAGWSRHTFELPNNAAGGKAKGRETEVLWCNF